MKIKPVGMNRYVLILIMSLDDGAIMSSRVQLLRVYQEIKFKIYSTVVTFIVFSQIFQRKILAYRMAMVGMADGRAGGVHN